MKTHGATSHLGPTVETTEFSGPARHSRVLLPSWRRNSWKDPLCTAVLLSACHVPGMVDLGLEQSHVLG